MNLPSRNLNFTIFKCNYFYRLADCFVIEPTVFTDNRGYFFESFNEKDFRELTGFAVHFVQDNQSLSKYGVLRGLHLQNGEHAQAKLVQVAKASFGRAVDLRDARRLMARARASCCRRKQKDVFHSARIRARFRCFERRSGLQYKCDNYYNKQSESGIHYADPSWRLIENTGK
jgi:dTDP-4-dehydrorhamnose 3,5-epimerase